MKLTEAQIEEYHERGMLFFPALFSPEEMAVLSRAAPALMARTGPEVIREDGNPEAVKLIFAPHFFDESYRRLASHPRLVIPAQQLLRSGIHVFQARINPKPGFTGSGWGWHQDFNQWYRHDGMKHPRCVMVAIFLDDINACNAPLMVIPGSQKWGHVYVPDRMEIGLDIIEEMVDAGGIEALLGPPGSVALLDCITVHGSGPNMTPWPRGIFYLNYNSVENQELESRRATFHCSTDFTPLEPLADDCLLATD